MKRNLTLLILLAAVMTNAQNQNSAHIEANKKNHARWDVGTKISERAANCKTDHLNIENTSYDDEVLNPKTDWNSYPNPFLQWKARESDAVIVGQIVGSQSALTTNERFIFADYDLRIDEVIKDSNSSHLVAGATIVVSQAGGSLDVNGKHVTARILSFPSFKNGSQYLLFLRYSPESRSYLPDASGSFELAQTRAIRLNLRGLDHHLDSKLANLGAFLSEVREAAASH